MVVDALTDVARAILVEEVEDELARHGWRQVRLASMDDRAHSNPRTIPPIAANVPTALDPRIARIATVAPNSMDSTTRMRDLDR